MNSKKGASRADKGVNLTIPTVGFRKIMPFNAFSLERIISGWIMHFALLKSDDIKLDIISLYISESDLKQNRSRVETYLSQIPDAEIVDQRWRPVPQEISEVGVVRFMQLARVGTEAEISFVFFPIHTIVGQQIPDNHNIQTDPVAVLISDLAVHRSFLLALFSDKS